MDHKSSLLLIVLFLSCSHKSSRIPASRSQYVSESQPKIFSPEYSKFSPRPSTLRETGRIERNYLFQSFSTDKTLVDLDPKKIRVKCEQGANPEDVSIERVSKGLYYFQVMGCVDNDTVHFFYEDQILESMEWKFKAPDPTRSSLKVIKNEGNVLCLELTLFDQEGQLMEASSLPEMIIDGNVSKIETEVYRRGVFHFRVEYFDHNQILYFSVRVNGAGLDHLLRFQHVQTAL